MEKITHCVKGLAEGCNVQSDFSQVIVSVEAKLSANREIVMVSANMKGNKNCHIRQSTRGRAKILKELAKRFSFISNKDKVAANTFLILGDHFQRFER